jgi:hypothetical protein
LVRHQNLVTNLEIEPIGNYVHAFGRIVGQGEFLETAAEEPGQLATNIVMRGPAPIQQIITDQGSRQIEVMGNRIEYRPRRNTQPTRV